MFKGHPAGLYRLFFIEMWERLAFYTMVGILLLYTIDTERGGLGLSKVVGNEIYGLYLAFVYFTPYLGGLIADRFLGYRRSVLIGGAFFATGFFLMSIFGQVTFVSGLVCLCIGNGFFKPNISTMVGNLYQPGDPKRDSGFNIFYMGINVGAFIANFLAAVMKNELGWPWIFRAAGIGMLISMVILLASWKLLARADRQPGVRPGDTPFRDILGKIIAPAVGVGVVAYFFAREFLPASVTSLVRPSDIGFLAGAVPIILFFVNLARRATPEEKPGLLSLLPIYVAGGTFFMVLHLNGSAMTTWAKEMTDRQVAWAEPDASGEYPRLATWFAERTFPSYYRNAAPSTPRPNRATLLVVDDAQAVTMFGQKRMDAATLEGVRRSLPEDVTVVELRTRDNWNRQLTEEEEEFSNLAIEVFPEAKVEETVGAHGEKEVSVTIDDAARPVAKVAFVRTLGDQRIPVYLVAPQVVTRMYDDYETEHGRPPPQMPPGVFLRTANPELYQSLNPFFVIALTPLIVAFFTWRQRVGKPVSTARKIFFGMVITAVAAAFMALAGFATDNGAMKVSWLWLVGFYMIVTTGELCLSPMALSLVTKLSPARFTGLTMGGWFFATAVGNKFSGFLGGLQSKMDPASFFVVITIAVSIVAFGIYLLLPKLDAALRKYGA